MMCSGRAFSLWTLLISMEAFSFGHLGSYVFPGNHKPHVVIDSESRTKLFAKLSAGPVMALMGLV